jgi:predicted nuclease with TOPRIM domain
MTGRELFNTLFGRDTARQVTEQAKEEFMSTVKPDENGKYDRVMVATAENTENIDPDSSSVTALYESGMGGILKLQKFQAPISDKDFVERFGEMGKRLDEAYKEGKFTEDEYNELNKGITELATKTKALSNERAASIEYAREQLKWQFNQQFENPDFATEDRLTAIQKKLERPGFATPIEKLLEMINEYRQKA